MRVSSKWNLFFNFNLQILSSTSILNLQNKNRGRFYIAGFHTLRKLKKFHFSKVQIRSIELCLLVRKLNQKILRFILLSILSPSRISISSKVCSIGMINIFSIDSEYGNQVYNTSFTIEGIIRFFMASENDFLFFLEKIHVQEQKEIF